MLSMMAANERRCTMSKHRSRKPIRSEGQIIQEKSVLFHRHHRLPRSRGGRTGDNIINLAVPVHSAWHYLFGNMNAKEVARYVSDTFIDPKYYLVCVPRRKAKPKHRRTRCMCTDCGAEVMKLLPKTNRHVDSTTCDCRSCYVNQEKG